MCLFHSSYYCFKRTYLATLFQAINSRNCFESFWRYQERLLFSHLLIRMEKKRTVLDRSVCFYSKPCCAQSVPYSRDSLFNFGLLSEFLRKFRHFKIPLLECKLTFWKFSPELEMLKSCTSEMLKVEPFKRH